MNYIFSHNTSTATIKIELYTKSTLSKNLIEYENKNYFSNLCKSGCVNYGNKWSCPPHSPTYSSYSKNYTHCLLILLTCDLSQFSYVKTEYMKIKASNSILKSQSDRLCRFLECNLNGKMISHGSCKLCKPCTKKTPTSNCKSPTNMRYSLESLGLNVEKISSDFFDHQLLWYKNKICPPHSSAVSCVLTNNALEEPSLIEPVIQHYSITG